MPNPALLAFLRFESPAYLVLLALIPVVIVLAIRSMSGLEPSRRILAIVLRSAVIAAIVLALAGAQRSKESDAQTVVFLVDRSASVPRDAQQAAFDYVKQSVSGLRPTKDRVAVIAFDGRSAVEQLPMSALGIDTIAEPLEAERTDLAEAMRMAMALFTEDSARRIVVMSDGNENAGSALEESDHYAAAGVPIDVWPARYQHSSEVVFERMAAPATATTDETVNLRMVLRSQQPTSGRIRIWHNEELVDANPDDPASSSFPVTLEAGANPFVVPVPLRQDGVHRFRAQFEPDEPGADTITANNEGRSFTVVTGQGRILILSQGGTAETETDLASAQILAAALRRENLAVDVEIAGAEPVDQVRLLEYSLVILSDVPASDFSDAERDALAVYVRDLGGGLVMVGGDDSFGAGGWMDTPVEEVMPVSFDIKSKRQIPKGGLALVMHACEVPQGNYIGERAAIAAVKTLSSRDMVGVLSYKWQGAEQRYWDVPFQDVGDKAGMVRLIRQMEMGDMPDFDAVMRPGVEALLAQKDLAVRHMIVISDFDPAPPRDDLIISMKENNITCSTIAIGYGGHNIDIGKARWMAENTGGKFYSTADYSKIPQIFMKESRVVRRSLINENPFTPALASGFPSTVAGLAGEGIPPLRGLVLTTAKPLAEVPLVRVSDDGPEPVLAHWQVGLGKSVAFTSGMWNKWGADWTQWPKFSKLWAQLARWASRQSSPAAFDISTSVQGDKGRIRIDALDKNASTIDFMNIEGALVNPSFASQRLKLTQTGPGRYEAEFDAAQSGSYVLNLAYRFGNGPDAVSGSVQTGVSVSFSPEYRETRTDEALLTKLAEKTGGDVLGPADTGRTFDPARAAVAESRRPIWEDLIRWMLLLFLLDVAIRRLAIRPREMARRISRFVSEIAGGRGPSEESAAVLATLKGTRERAREASAPAARPASDAGTPPNRAARYEGPTTAAESSQQLSDVLGGASEIDAPVVARPTRKAPPTSEPDFTSRLLKAKQRAKEELDKKDPKSEE